ncbi:centrosomal protein of 152 kDa isoform X2 [Salarias fasciatus]|uniref:centrosomal protein of 152 kDa isoform X2 n=1 Tax=Salarias fasciatus TaxID=181472 RepID=UPI0011767844|nr:centrosomal protein of 152 kDa isoform X2 [Salarias fasciatus]
MSMDFDSAALQTQHDEEEYDQEDYAREQELHKLLTDLPHDMLDDSRDSTPSDLEYSACSNKNTGSSPPASWTQQWSDNPASHAQNYEVDYNRDSHNGHAYEDEVHSHGHQSQPQSQPLAHTWKQDHQFAQGDYACVSIGTEQSAETCEFSTEFQSDLYPQTTNNHVEYNAERGYMDKQSHFQATYNPQHPAHQPKMFNSQGAQQDAHYDHLQREFLDTTQQNSERQQFAQLQILNKAQQRQIEDLEQKLEDARRKMRYVEHQFAIVRDEKDGLAVSLKESSQLVEEAKVREIQMQSKLKVLEQQVQILNDRNQENMKKQMVADAAVDSMKQQMLELCRSDTLSRARQQHDRDLTVMKEQHDSAVLALQQKLDSTSHSLKAQVDVCQSLREQVKQLECQREEQQLERAKVINALTQRLEESQQHCAKLLETSSVQEMSQMQIKLQQAQSAKALSENMNKVLQEDMADLKEQITLYESAIKHGVIALEPSSDWENQLSESCLDLGLKKTNRKNGLLHSTALTHLSDSKLPKDEALRLLRVEMQRCLGSLKGKRQKISQLQEELQHCQAQVNELQKELEEVKVKAWVRESSQMKQTDVSGDSQKELQRLQEDKRLLQEQLESLDQKHKELKQSEEKLKAANSELCSRMREMIQELDQEKQEATVRSERIHQQYRDDVVNQIRTELTLEHEAQMEELTVQHQQQLHLLQTQLSEVNDKMLGVQECYLAICNEKNMLEESIRKREQEEAAIRDQASAAVEKLRTELEAQHQASIIQLKAAWSKEKKTEIQQQVNSQVSAAKAKWKEEMQKTEKIWTQKLEDAKRPAEMDEATCQTDAAETTCLTVTAEELDSRLSAQKQQLQQEADKAQRKAVEEARKQAQREAQEKYLEDMAKQVEGAVTRAYTRWIDDLTSLPEYQASLITEQKKWEELQEKRTEQQVSQALKDAEERWQKKKLEEQSPGGQQVEDLQRELAALQNQLEQVTREQAAVMKAELAGAREAWNRDKRQEIAMIQARSEQVYQTKLQEQLRKLEQTREDAELQKKEILLQMEAKFQQTVRTREEEWRSQCAAKELTHTQQLREEFKAELETGLAGVQAELLNQSKPEHQDGEERSGTTAEPSIRRLIHTSCTDLIKRAVSQAKKEWEKTSEERIRRMLKEIQERHEREINKIQSSFSERKQASSCRKECAQNTSKLQKKNNELQRHLEKACRQLQHSVREHKTAVQQLKDEHHSSLQKAKEEHLQQLEEVKRGNDSARCSDQLKLQEGLEEMKQQYLLTVEKIRGDMLRYLQESRERAADMIRKEVQRERQDTARKMRHYYLSCLQELLEDGGKSTGAEKKIMNAASKLVAMAKVFETPVKSKSGRNHNLPGCSTAVSSSTRPPGGSGGSSKDLASQNVLPGTRAEERPHRDETGADSEQNPAATVRTKLLNHSDKPSREKDETSADAGMKTKNLHLHKSRHPASFPSAADFENVSTRGKNRELYLQESDNQGRPFLCKEAPVREDKHPDRSLTGSDSEASFHLSTLSFLGRKVEPVKPFAVPAASHSVIGEFGALTPDVSDLTVYNEISKKTPYAETSALAIRVSQREPTPGSECETQQAVCSRPLFSELRLHQQDSGFDSPFYQQN